MWIGTGWHSGDAITRWIVSLSFGHNSKPGSSGPQCTMLAVPHNPVLPPAHPGDEEVAQAIIEAAKTSMGQDISPIDLINIKTFAARVISLRRVPPQVRSCLPHGCISGSPACRKAMHKRL